MQMSRIDFRTVRRSVQESRLSARPTFLLSGRQAVNIMRSVSSIFASSRRLVSLGLCLGLAACGSSQNWDDDSQVCHRRRQCHGLLGRIAGVVEQWHRQAHDPRQWCVQVSVEDCQRQQLRRGRRDTACRPDLHGGERHRHGAWRRFQRDRDLRALHLHAARAARDLQHGQGHQLQPVPDRRGTHRRSRCPATRTYCRTSRCSTRPVSTCSGCSAPRPRRPMWWLKRSCASRRRPSRT